MVVILCILDDDCETHVLCLTKRMLRGKLCASVCAVSYITSVVGSNNENKKKKLRVAGFFFFTISMDTHAVVTGSNIEWPLNL